MPVRLLTLSTKNILNQGRDFFIEPSHRTKSIFERFAVRFVVILATCGLIDANGRHAEQLCSHWLPVLVLTAYVSLLIDTAVLKQFEKGDSLLLWLS